MKRSNQLALTSLVIASGVQAFKYWGDFGEPRQIVLDGFVLTFVIYFVNLFASCCERYLDGAGPDPRPHCHGTGEVFIPQHVAEADCDNCKFAETCRDISAVSLKYGLQLKQETE